MGEKERQNGLCTVRRNWRHEGGEPDISSLRWLPPEAMVMSPPILLLRARSGSVVLQQQGPVLVSVSHIATKGHGDIPGLDSRQGLVHVRGLQKAGPTPHPLQDLGEQALHPARAVQQSWPCWWGHR